MSERNEIEPEWLNLISSGTNKNNFNGYLQFLLTCYVLNKKIEEKKMKLMEKIDS